MSEEIWTLKLVVEAILFASQRPVSLRDLQGILEERRGGGASKFESCCVRQDQGRNTSRRD